MITPLSNSLEHLSVLPGKTRNYLGGKYGLIRRLPFACNFPDDSRRHCLESCTRLRLFRLSGLGIDRGPDLVWTGTEMSEPCARLTDLAPDADLSWRERECALPILPDDSEEPSSQGPEWRQ
jgi:hypothetical protein